MRSRQERKSKAAPDSLINFYYFKLNSLLMLESFLNNQVLILMLYESVVLLDVRIKRDIVCIFLGKVLLRLVFSV